MTCGSRQPSWCAWRLPGWLGCVLIGLLLPASLAAQGATEIRAAEARSKPPLSPLPKAPSRRFATPEAADLELLEQVLERIRAVRKPNVRASLDELLEVDASLLPAIRRRIDLEAERANRKRMKRLLLDIRREARSDLKRQLRAPGDVVTPDYLEMVLTYPKVDRKSYRRLVNLLALSRLCVRLGTVRATRALIRIYVRFDFMRIDTQLQMQKLGDRALPGLIEATRHPAPNVARWARKQLDFIGKAIPSEAVAVDDPQVLADALRAYGFLKDPDAARLIISFANSERSQVRLAARQAVTSMGEIANWQLRDTYEQMVGKKPPRDWSWDRTAKELFREFDLIRLAEVYRLYDEGLQAKKAGNLEDMRKAFDRVLTRDPDFDDESGVMAAGYLAYGQQALTRLSDDGQLGALFADSKDASKLKTGTTGGAASSDRRRANVATLGAALQRATRLTTDENQKRAARSLSLTLDAHRQLARGLADQTLLRRALKLDPENQLARQLLEEISRQPLSESGPFMRFLWPAVLGGLAILLAVIVVVRRPRKSDAVATEASS